jgi:zinc D-Ala-D-Ala carboxypeptidase
MKLSNNFHLEEFIFSQTAQRLGIKNQPNQIHINNMNALCANILQPLRDSIGLPIKITSGYRSPELNKAIGGSQNSQHSNGEAADIVVIGLTPQQVCLKIIELNLPFDQLIHEFNSWTHVSYSSRQRRQRLTINRKGTFKGIL